MQKSGLSLNFEEVRKICLRQVAKPEDIACVQLVYSHAGWWAAHTLWYISL